MRLKYRTQLVLLLMVTSLFFAGYLHTSGASSGDILITEVLYDAPGSDSSEEWIELYNPGMSSININGWTIEDNSYDNILPDVSIPGGGYFILARDPTGFQALYGFTPDYDSTLALNNGGDQLTLKDSTGTIIDFVAWESGYNSAYPSWTVSGVDTTIHRLDDGNGQPLDTDSSSDWADSTSLGSPDNGYGGSGDTEAPLVTITNPSDGGTVGNTISITCTASDNVGISSVSLLIDGGVVASSSSSPTTYNWDTTTYQNGATLTLRCEATDSSSNLGIDEIGVTVDNSPISDKISVYFTDPLAGIPQMTNFAAQQGNMTTGIVDLLNSANTTIDAALYHLTWQPVIDALNDAHARGVTVRVAYHGDNAAEFDALDPAISTTAVTTSYTMHNKFFIVDSSITFTGSWNPTDTGTLFNANDALRIESSDVAAAYESEFNQLYANIYANSKTDDNAELFSIGSTQVEVYFSPRDNGRARLIELINDAQISIHISMFYLTDNSIYNALDTAISRGVNVQLVADYRGWRNSYAEADDLINAGAGIVDANPGVYHHKFAVFDSAILWTGSTNWSAAGFDSNDENAVVIHSSEIAEKYVARTIAFWNDAQNYDNSVSDTPRIVTRHYSSWSYSNMISWRLRMDGNIASDTADQYLVWRWNDTTSSWQTIRELNWASGYYPDTTVEYDTMYYYCLSTLTDGVHSDCSAEFASQANSDGSNTQEVISQATGHLDNFGVDTISPTVNIENPSHLETVEGYLDIWASVVDDSYINNYEILVDGVVVATTSYHLLDTQPLTDGSHSIEIRAQDIFGNWGSSSISVIVDNSNYVKPVQDYSDVKIMSYNVDLYQQQLDETIDFRTGLGNLPFMDVLKEENADIFILEETGGVEQFGNATLNRIVTELNEYFSTELPYQCATPPAQVAGYGGGTVCSRFTVTNAQFVPIITLDDGSSADVSHDFFDVTIQLGDESVHIIPSHLKASSGTSNEVKREIAQEGILNYIDTLGSTHVIYAGDMNSYAPGEPCETGTQGGCDLGYGPMNMTLNPSHPKTSQVYDFYNTFRTANPDTGSNPGYTYESTSYGKSVIDYLLVNDLGGSGLINHLLSATVGDTASAGSGSDHKSVDAIFDLSSWAPTDTIPPSQVTGLSASAVSESQIDLSWTANVESDLNHYNIYRNGSFLTQTSSTTFSDTGLSSSTSYTYEVSAVDTSGNEGALSSPVTETTQTGSTGLDHIVISEVYYDVQGSDSKGEWIELYNPLSTNVDLTGWTIEDNSGSYTIPAGTIIAAGDFLVFARDASGFQRQQGFNPDLGDLTLSLSNSGDLVRLLDASSTEVDFVAWEGEVGGWNIQASTGETIARSNLTTDSDTSSDWTSVANEGTPGSI